MLAYMNKFKSLIYLSIGVFAVMKVLTERHGKHQHKGERINLLNNQRKLLIVDSSDGEFQNVKPSSRGTTKNILFYTDFYHQPSWPYLLEDPGSQGFKKYNCPVSDCYLTNNASYLPSVADFDAVMFNLWHHDILDRSNRSKLAIPDQNERRRSQRYILLMKDPPTQATPKDKVPTSMLAGIFNWSMTHRLDSDLPSPYGLMTRINPSRPLNEEKFRKNASDWIPFDMERFLRSPQMKSEYFTRLAERKKRGVAWIVSHCSTFSKREEYVYQLEKYIELDVFGNCGYYCDKQPGNCMEPIYKYYKFYLSFENSLCDYYVTEKFWRTIKHDIIPVVRGRGHYEEMAPPHSYIDVDDFDGPEDLAKYLHHLSNNKEEYLSYFWWKSFYEPNNMHEQMWMTMCEMCHKLHDESEPEKVLEEEDLEEMLKCHNPPQGDSEFNFRKLWRTEHPVTPVTNPEKS